MWERIFSLPVRNMLWSLRDWAPSASLPLLETLFVSRRVRRPQLDSGGMSRGLLWEMRRIVEIKHKATHQCDPGDTHTHTENARRGVIFFLDLKDGFMKLLLRSQLPPSWFSSLMVVTRVWPALHTSRVLGFNASEQQLCLFVFFFGWKSTKWNAHGAILHHNVDHLAFSILCFYGLESVDPSPPPGCVMSFISLTFIKNFVTTGGNTSNGMKRRETHRCHSDDQSCCDSS